MKTVKVMSDDESAQRLTRLLDVGGTEMRIGLLPAHAEIKLWKPCPRKYRMRDGTVVKCGRKKSPHYCEPRVAHIKEVWSDLMLPLPPYTDKPYELLDWNEEKVRQVYGVVVADPHWNMWVRNYNMVYIVGTRGGLKTIWLAGNGCVWMAIAEPGTQMVMVSQTEQAAEDVAAGYMEKMIGLSPMLKDAGVKYLKSKQKFVREDEAITTEMTILSTRHAGSGLGRRLGLIIVDEFDAVPNMQGFWRDATYSWGLQPEPLGIMASTVAEDYASYEAEQTERMRDVLEKPWLDPRTVPVLNIADEGTDWRDDDARRKINFHIGLGLLDESTLDAEKLRAEGDPQMESDYARFRMGIRLSPHSSYIPMAIWDRNHPKPGFETLAKMDAEMALWPVFLGVDFGEISDWTACVAMCFDDRFRLFLRGWYWIPRSNIAAMDKRLGGRVSRWIDEGWLQVMEDRQVGIESVAHEIAHICERYPDMRAIGYDQTKALAARTVWEQSGLYCDSVAQGYKIQEGALEIKYKARDNKLVHAGDPVLRYFFESAELKLKTMDNKEIVKPERDKSARRVDGAVAAATACYMRKLHLQYAPHSGPAGSTADVLWQDVDESYDDDETASLVLP